jgi:hypothetical protein
LGVARGADRNEHPGDDGLGADLSFRCPLPPFSPPPPTAWSGLKADSSIAGGHWRGLLLGLTLLARTMMIALVPVWCLRRYSLWRSARRYAHAVDR